MKHTKEPWIIGGTVLDEYEDYVRAIEDDIGAIIATTCINGEFHTRDANAKRIVACVNACAGIANETLERYTLYNIKELNNDPYVHDLEQEIEMLEVRIERLNRILTVNGISVQ